MEDPTMNEQNEANIDLETEQNDATTNPDLDPESDQEQELKDTENKFSSQDQQDSLEEKPRCSVSPKVARPKLPEFTGNGRISSHARSKTDPGRGGEIKAIIDKTMEDIKELNKVDFTIYNRPKVFPKPLHQRSQSTHASPRASPTPSSPSVEEKVSALNRNRSRSLKVLTDMLKSGRGGNDFRSGNIPDVGNEVKSNSDSQLLPRRQGKESSVERRSSSDGQLQANRQDSSGDVTEESGVHDACTPDIYSHHREHGQSDRHYSDRSEHKHKGSTIPRYRQESGKFRRAKSEVRKAAPISDDEGLDVTSDHESGGHGLVKPFHSIDTNSKFFTLYKTNPSTRRPHFSGFGKPRYKSNSQGEEQATRSDDQIGSANRRFTRLELTPLSSKNTKSRISTLRHVTHPPQSQTTFREGGTMDSNGFGTLLKSPSTESPPPFPGEVEKTSDLSLTDSQTGQSDSMDEASYGEQDEQSETRTESCDNASDVDTIKPTEKKGNGKSLKQKSKSDPSSDKSQSVDQSELPQLISVSQSTPHLSTDGSQETEEEVTPEATLDTDSQEEDKRQRTLSSHESFDDGMPLQFDTTCSTGGSGSPMSYSIEEEGLLSPDSDGPPPSFVSVMYGVTSAPSTPVNQSPTNTLERTNYLNVPTNVTVTSTANNKKSIGRSASSASVMNRERKFSGGSKDKDSIRKHSVTIGDDAAATSKPELFPLGDSSGMQALSMPSMTTTWKKERGPSMSPERDQSLVKDKRYHIVEEFYHNEKEYVEALQKLKDKYMTPLKVSSNIDEAVVDNIFYMIPEILTHHTIYLDFLENVWAKWDTKTSTIGNIIIGIFSKQTVVDSYLSFVENYRTSGKVIENALQTKSSVQKFIEQCQRDSGSKLSMKDLIVRPIQRIPRYELLIQRLIENTPPDHPDFPLLKEAERVMHNFAIKLGTVNESQHEEDQQSTLKKLELLVPDMSPLVAPDRQYLKHDMVQILTKKDQCCIWIFSDLVIFSSIKRRGGPVTRKVSVILKSPTGNEYAENIKHKVWLRVGLDNIEIVKSQIPPSKKSSLDPDQLEEDINILTEITDMTNKLNYPHSSLDDVVKEMLASLNKQFSEVCIRSPTLESNKMEILVTTQEGVYPLEICFSSAEKRAIWESTLLDAKQKLSLLSDKRAPEFQQPLQITKTRAGMQFSCAAPIDGLNNSGYRDVWVCNSDGYVGHMCLLSLQPEPIVTLNTPVPGCNARILCICAVPAFSGPFRRKSSSKKNLHKHSVPPVAEDGPQINIEEVDDVSEPEEDAASGYQTDSESSDEDEEEELEEEGEGEKELEGEEEAPQEKEEGETVFDNKPKDLYLGESEGKASPVSQLINLDPFTMTGNWLQDAHKSTMWLGTEDGCIHIFQCTDNIKTTKNKLKIHHGSPVYCIVYLDNKVFVSLANGDLIVYKRDSDGIWDTENPYTRTVGSVISPISRMLAVAGKLWCGCQNIMNVINPLTLRIETTFQVTSDSSRCIQCLVCAGQGVWLASQHSSKISLYHATSFEPLLEVNIAHSVAQKLQSADDIIRQHKAACLRITALLVCKDLLWVGTSAGVILTIPMPRITSTSTRGSISTPSVTGLVFGHTGHVRFLTCVELTAPSSPTTPKPRAEDEETDNKPDNLAIHDIHRRSSMAATTATMATRMLVISGGDGYEDFRNNSTNEVAGRDDSTNHLLLWQV
ncbi:rho guanine nucleotide exchange factor 17-like [Ylistrum balloti]|uniref:rho guanine nucleotide exchange factor 17-like n=1 Tax=Ylistrum balloti TaxID=509963 RepID=UPI0029059038|nr:rho guanine nucleotide exchange factor 17-like [Ylistrum balloti]